MKNAKNGKKLNKALLVGTALVSLSSPQQVGAVDVTGDVSAIILLDLTAAMTQELHFGSMVVTDATGDIVVGPVSGRGAGTGGITEVVGSALEQVANLEITAATGQQINLTVGAGPFTVDDGGAGLAMTVDNFNIGTDAAGQTVTTSIVGPATNVIVPVGARLNLPTGQATALSGATGATTFTGTYTISVNY